MNKVVMCLICVFIQNNCSDISSEVYHKEKNRAEIFKQDCEKYLIDPGWVIADFLKMNQEEFDAAWHYFVNFFTKNPEFIFGKRRKNFSEKKERECLLEHCRHYAEFLDGLFIDTVEKKLIFQKTSIASTHGIISIYRYWDIKKDIDVHHFYAFYFDRIAADFVEAVMNTEHEEVGIFSNKSFQKIDSLLSRLYTLLSHLKNSEYDSRYAYQLRRYQEVYGILYKEGKKRYGGMV